MDIINFGYFKSIKNNYDYMNEDNQLWIDELRPSLTTWSKTNGEFIDSVYGTWATVTDDGRVEYVTHDPSELVPDNRYVIAFDTSTDKIKKNSHINLDTKEITPPKRVKPIPSSISDRQFFQALASEPYNMISKEEALAGVKTGEIPSAMQDVLNGMNEEQRFQATMLISGATIFYRDDPLVRVFGESQDMSEEQIDEFFLFANSL